MDAWVVEGMGIWLVQINVCYGFVHHIGYLLYLEKFTAV